MVVVLVDGANVDAATVDELVLGSEELFWLDEWEVAVKLGANPSKALAKTSTASVLVTPGMTVT